jgi:hypothetical protein
MELKIDQEFEELIPPLTSEEYESLEKNIVENGFNPAFPIIHWNETVIDGHNRYGICKKNNIEFTTIAQEFPSRSAALMWIIDNQLARRNINDVTKTDLIGRRYNEEKKAVGENQYTMNSVKWSGNSYHPKTAGKIANQVNVSEKTVRNAAEFAKAIDKITVNTGISRQSLLIGKIKLTQKDIVELATKCSPEIQAKVIAKVTDNQETDIRNAMRKVQQEERDRALKEAEEKKRLEAERLRKEREERERLEAERLRKEREERERVEKERLEKERIEREKARKEREEQERIKRELWEKEKAENERIRKEKAEKARLEQERLAKERAEKARIERERLEKERQELEKQRKERLEKERIEKERLEQERLKMEPCEKEKRKS